MEVKRDARGAESTGIVQVDSAREVEVLARTHLPAERDHTVFSVCGRWRGQFGGATDSGVDPEGSCNKRDRVDQKPCEVAVRRLEYAA